MSMFQLARQALVAAVIMSPYVAQAQDYPERDATLVVQGSAGGGSDIFARTIAKHLDELDITDRRLLVENRPGGSGSVAYTYTARQAGNPYVLQTIASSFFTTPLLGQSPVGPADFTPVAAIAVDPYVLAVHSDSEFTSFDEFIAAGSITAGTTGVVNDQTILAALLEEASGIQIRSVPFDGSGEVMSAVLGGHVDAIFGNPSEILQQVEAGDVRPLAVSTKERLDSLPDVPTFSELGYDISHSQVRAIVMPGDVSAEALNYWVSALEQLAESDLWRTEYLEPNSMEAGFIAGDELDTLFRNLTGHFETQMKSAGLIE